MAEADVEVEVQPCSNPGCDQSGTSFCGKCGLVKYCCRTCQTADWVHHKDECPGHLRKVGMAHLAKALGFHEQQNWMQELHYADLATTKLKQLKDRRLETVEAISEALGCKYNALGRLNRHREAMESAEECYTMWAMNHLRNEGSLRCASALIQSYLQNEKYEDAEFYARHLMFLINDMTDNSISVDRQLLLLAEGSYLLAVAIHELTKAGGIPPEEKQKVGEESIELVRKALEIHIQRYGTENARVALDMATLAEVLDYFNNVNDDEILRLLEQAIAILRRVEGSLSPNMAGHERKLGFAYGKRANNALDANDHDRFMANLELALPHFRESVRIYRAMNNHLDKVDEVLFNVAQTEEQLGFAYCKRSNSAYDGNDLDRCMVNLELALPHFRKAARVYRAINHMDRADEALFQIAQHEKNIRNIKESLE